MIKELTKKQIKQIEKYIPNKINTFYDIFGGSGTMSINMVKRSKKVVYNEFDKWVYNLFNFYKNTNPEEIHKETIKISKKYGYSYRNYFEYLKSIAATDYTNFRYWLIHNIKSHNMEVLESWKEN